MPTTRLSLREARQAQEQARRQILSYRHFCEVFNLERNLKWQLI